jgi:hypothetical protein
LDTIGRLRAWRHRKTAEDAYRRIVTAVLHRYPDAQSVLLSNPPDSLFFLDPASRLYAEMQARAAIDAGLIDDFGCLPPGVREIVDDGGGHVTVRFESPSQYASRIVRLLLAQRRRLGG